MNRHKFESTGKGLPFEERTVDLLDNPEDFKEQYASMQADPLARVGRCVGLVSVS